MGLLLPIRQKHTVTCFVRAIYRRVIAHLHSDIALPILKSRQTSKSVESSLDFDCCVRHMCPTSIEIFLHVTFKKSSFKLLMNSMTKRAHMYPKRKGDLEATG